MKKGGTGSTKMNDHMMMMMAAGVPSQMMGPANGVNQQQQQFSPLRNKINH
jgi:hypothetical protein